VTAIADLDAEAVVHLAITTAPDKQNGGRAAMKEQNVIGTMQLLAACQQAPRLRKLVVRSSTAAYGASFRDPAVFTEDTEPRAVPRGGFARDILDIEGYVRGFRRRRPKVIATVLRFAPFVGSNALTTLTRYFSSPVVPTVLGRDPRLQFVHVDDALEVLYRSVVEDHSGTFNVAGPGVLALSQAIRRAGRVALPVLEPGLSFAAGVARSFGVTSYGFDQLDLFVHGRVVDITRLIREYGFTPRSTAEAFDDFIRAHESGKVVRAEQLTAAEQTILDGIRKVRAVVGRAEEDTP
jgi:UDP-glucose 4-epimerase